MPVWSNLFGCRLISGRKIRRGGWPVRHPLFAVLAVLCVSRCAGAAGQPSVSLSPTSLSFGNQLPGTTSSAKALTLTNTGDATLSISKIWLTGGYPNLFKESNNCGTSLAKGAKCTISVQFAPNKSGPFAAAVTLADNAGNSPQSVAVSGGGSAAAPTLSLSASSLAFGNQQPGTTSSAKALTLTNTGDATLSISKIWLTGGYPNLFKESNNCGTSLAEGAKCTISVQFAPNAIGSFAAAVTLEDNGANSPQSVPISGTGSSSSGSSKSSTSTSPGVSVSPSSLSFGNQPIDVASSSETLTLTNNASTALSISKIALTGTDPADFTENHTCGSSLAAGGSCTIVTLFTPSASGSLSASLSITDNASGSPQTVALSGTGTHDVILSWSSGSGASGYDIYRGTSSGGESSTPLNSEPIAGTTYTDTSVEAGKTYYYKIKSVASNGSTKSGSSTEVSATVPSS
jgi:centrosomal CEP192-like protein